MKTTEIDRIRQAILDGEITTELEEAVRGRLPLRHDVLVAIDRLAETGAPSLKDWHKVRYARALLKSMNERRHCSSARDYWHCAGQYTEACRG